MSEHDKPASSQDERPYVPRRRKYINHCARFWWAYLIVVICIIVLVVCLIIFVAIPNMAQSKLNSATLDIQGITVSNTQTNSFDMAINSTITSSGGVSATIDSFQGEMYLEDLEAHTPFAVLTFPQTTADAFQVVNVSQSVNVTNVAALTAFNTWLLMNDTLRVTLAGNTYVRVSGISKAFPVSFTKTVTIPGLRMLNGTTVTQSSISLTPDADGNNLFGYVTIPNYSVVTFDIGNATFKSYLLGEEVGNVYVDDIVLVSGGLNNFTIAANISQAPVLSALGLQPYCSNGGELPFQLQGSNVINHGQYLAYYANALAAGNQTVLLPIGADLKKDNVVVNCGGGLA